MPQTLPLRAGHLIAAVTAATVTFAGCMVGPGYVRPPLEPPASFKSPAPASPERGIDPSREGGPSGDQSALPEEWWRLYRDADLDRLVATATASNQTIRQAVARVDEARALARVAGSYRYPTISLGAVYARQRTSGDRVSTVTGQPVASS